MRSLRTTIAAFAILLLALPSLPAPVSAAQAPKVPQVTGVFCVHGGVGMSSETPPPYFAVAVLDVDLPAAASSMLGVSEFTLLSETNVNVASLRGVEAIVRLDVVPPSPLDATYLNPEGTPVTGPLPPGLTRVRIRMRLDHRPTHFASRYRITLTGLGKPVSVSGTLSGEWPT